MAHHHHDHHYHHCYRLIYIKQSRTRLSVTARPTTILTTFIMTLRLLLKQYIPTTIRIINSATVPQRIGRRRKSLSKCFNFSLTSRPALSFQQTTPIRGQKYTARPQGLNISTTHTMRTLVTAQVLICLKLLQVGTGPSLGAKLGTVTD